MASVRGTLYLLEFAFDKNTMIQNACIIRNWCNLTLYGYIEPRSNTNGQDLQTKYNKLKEKAIKFKRERDAARDNERLLKERIEHFEIKTMRDSRISCNASIKDNRAEILELEDDIRLYQEKVAQIGRASCRERVSSPV